MKLLLLALFMLPAVMYSQETSRIKVDGILTASKAEDVEGVTLFNISSGKGTVSNAEGHFTIEVGDRDRLLISALQFQDFTIIISDKELVEKMISIYLNPNINRLDEVLVRSTDLTGNLESDIKRIKTSVFTPEWDLSYAVLEYDYNFERDQYTKIDGNAAEEALNMNNMPVVGVDVIKLVALFFPNKRKTPKQLSTDKFDATKQLWQKYDIEYLSVTFNLPEEKVSEFVYFVEDKGLPLYLLNEKNEIKLLAYLFDQSSKYKLLLADRD